MAYCINFGTYQMTGPSSWRITMGIGFIFPTLMACGTLQSTLADRIDIDAFAGIMLLRESPRWDYRKGNIDRARATIAKSYGVSESHWEVQREIREIRDHLNAETNTAWHEIVTGPKMTYRLLLGIALQALQQLTGVRRSFPVLMFPAN